MVSTTPTPEMSTMKLEVAPIATIVATNWWEGTGMRLLVGDWTPREAVPIAAHSVPACLRLGTVIGVPNVYRCGWPISLAKNTISRTENNSAITRPQILVARFIFSRNNCFQGIDDAICI